MKNRTFISDKQAVLILIALALLGGAVWYMLSREVPEEASADSATSSYAEEVALSEEVKLEADATGEKAIKAITSRHDGGFAVGERGYSLDSKGTGVVLWFPTKEYAQKFAEIDADSGQARRELLRLYSEGKGIVVGKGTQIVVLESSGSLRKVEGFTEAAPEGGTIGWVSTVYLSKEFPVNF